MDIYTLIFFVLATAGLVHIIVDSSLFESIRNYLDNRLTGKLKEVYHCHQCCGFWCGLFCGAILITLNPFLLLCCGFAGSYIGMVSDTILTRLESE